LWPARLHDRESRGDDRLRGCPQQPHALPLIAVICNNCANTLWFNANSLPRWRAGTPQHPSCGGDAI